MAHGTLPKFALSSTPRGRVRSVAFRYECMALDLSVLLHDKCDSAGHRVHVCGWAKQTDRWEPSRTSRLRQRSGTAAQIAMPPELARFLLSESNALDGETINGYGA